MLGGRSSRPLSSTLLHVSLIRGLVEAQSEIVGQNIRWVPSPKQSRQRLPSSLSMAPIWLVEIWFPLRWERKRCVTPSVLWIFSVTLGPYITANLDACLQCLPLHQRWAWVLSFSLDYLMADLLHSSDGRLACFKSGFVCDNVSPPYILHLLSQLTSLNL